MKQSVVVSSDGSCYWWTTIEQASSHCGMEIAWFPLDTQRCELIFESWTMNSQEMNMTAMHPSVDVGKYKHNEEWELTGEQLQSIPSVVYKRRCAKLAEDFITLVTSCTTNIRISTDIL